MYTWYTSKVWATPHLKLVEPEMKILSAITNRLWCEFFDCQDQKKKEQEVKSKWEAE